MPNSPRKAARPARRATDEPLVLNALRRIMQALRVTAVQTHNQTGISAAQLFVLSQLAAGGRHSIRQLAEATMTDRSSVADVVDRLVERGLVWRRASREDRRRAEVQIRAAGRKLLAQAPKAPTARLLDGLAGLTANELRALAAGLERLCEEMGLSELAPQMLFEAHGSTRQATAQ